MAEEDNQITKNFIKRDNESKKRKSLNIISSFNEIHQVHQSDEENVQESKNKETHDKSSRQQLFSRSSFDVSILRNEQDSCEIRDLMPYSKLTNGLFLASFLPL